MKTIKVGIRTFRILEPWEVKCDHDFSIGVMVEKVINPNKEFVEGHGCDPLVVRFTGDRKCIKCGMLESVFLELSLIHISNEEWYRPEMKKSTRTPFIRLWCNSR